MNVLKPIPRKRKWTAPVMATIMGIVVIGSVLGIYYSPDYSWDDTIRDSDGDGYADDVDPYPNDPTKWTSPAVTPTTSLTNTAIIEGMKLVFGSGAEVPWSDITILLSDGSHHESWDNLSSADLDDIAVDLKNYGNEYIGDLCVSLKVVDLSGNGYVNQGDYFILAAEAFSSDILYCAYVLHDSTGEEITRCEFNG